MPEQMRPISNTRAESITGLAKFYGRMVLDLQSLTIFQGLRRILPSFKGKILDVGCGHSPYKFLLPKKESSYFGVDTAHSGHFGYNNADITLFDGRTIPFESDSFDGVICTEVLEHVYHYQALVDEIYRVLKPMARAVVTVPWSARNHFIPYDYFRYSPSALREIFSRFSSVDVQPRGSDICALFNIVVVMWWRSLFPDSKRNWFFTIVGAALGTPLVVLLACFTHLALLCKLGSQDQPLGYTIYLSK